MSEQLAACRRCPRLVAWREQVAETKRASFRDENYWGRPVPAFGDPAAPILVVGLAPAAHGANRTGRMFTGDRSGDWLFGSLHRTGLANQPSSEARGDGLRLLGIRITAIVRCAPPDNKPTPDERDRCRTWLELDITDAVQVIVTLGQMAYDQSLRVLRDRGELVPKPKPRFGHGVEVSIGRRTLIASYHPSQHNTFTGRLTESMLDDVFEAAVRATDRN